MKLRQIRNGADDRGVFVGREAEVERLRGAIERRESLAIWGPADSGKTTLVRQAIAGLPGETARQCIYRPLRGAP
ncbi:MAG TPA: hypothetical protein VJW51_03690 [Candidatus Acidoferrales bacterium]|nr:hypothetical protein [Candidatus Acidoferrales bacterium]